MGVELSPNIVQLLIFTLRPYSHSPNRSGSFRVCTVRRNAGVAEVDSAAVGIFMAGHLLGHLTVDANLM